MLLYIVQACFSSPYTSVPFLFSFTPSSFPDITAYTLFPPYSSSSQPLEDPSLVIFQLTLHQRPFYIPSTSQPLCIPLFIPLYLPLSIPFSPPLSLPLSYPSFSPIFSFLPPPHCQMQQVGAPDTE